MQEYHDTEWGRPVRGDRALFERICLEAFQAGLSWRTVLLRRAVLREVFAGFDPVALAELDDDWVDSVLQDSRIIRNRAKVRATVANARATLRLQALHGPDALDSLIWSHQPNPHPRPVHLEQVPAQTAQSVALAGTLRSAGFVFVGPTTAYALMQACGLVNDHVRDCPVQV
jgi:DNA-3-methyladenine glycosylase I